MKKALKTLERAVDVAVWRMRRNTFDLLLYVAIGLVLLAVGTHFLVCYGAVIKHFVR